MFCLSMKPLAVQWQPAKSASISSPRWFLGLFNGIAALHQPKRLPKADNFLILEPMEIITSQGQLTYLTLGKGKKSSSNTPWIWDMLVPPGGYSFGRSRKKTGLLASFLVTGISARKDVLFWVHRGCILGRPLRKETVEGQDVLLVAGLGFTAKFYYHFCYGPGIIHSQLLGYRTQPGCIYSREVLCCSSVCGPLPPSLPPKNNYWKSWKQIRKNPKL